jgi:GT2 family glycosyltransferase
MKTSIIIPIFNQKKYTQNCLESIFECGSKYDFEVIVVDNASTDGSREYLDGFRGTNKNDGKDVDESGGGMKGSREYLSGLSDKLTIIHNKKNLGFAKACNQGAKVARGEYLMFLNNDTVVTDGWLDVLVKELDGNERIAIVGPKLLYPDDTIQHAGVVFDEKKWPHHIYKRERKNALHVNKKRRFQCLTAACFLMKSHIFHVAGGFDEVYVNGLEDLDMCLKVQELGYGALYCPSSVVYHYESITEGRSNYDEKNYQIFSTRWNEKIRTDHRDFMAEDAMNGMGEFLDVWTSDEMSYKKLSYLLHGGTGLTERSRRLGGDLS